jgi:NADH dehydrogenase (ubiquinone) 1 alpha subcomplex subunit 5
MATLNLPTASFELHHPPPASVSFVTTTPLVIMRATTRLLAQVRKSRFLEPGAPTGLTGLLTSPHPRPQLMSIYNRTLEKLQAFPESSVYRQSTEALTRHRLNLVENTKPEGLEAYESRRNQLLAEHAEHFKQYAPDAFKTSGNVWYNTELYNPDYEPATNIHPDEPQPEGPRPSSERDAKHAQMIAEEFEALDKQETPQPTITLEAEPPLTADQYVFPFTLAPNRPS